MQTIIFVNSNSVSLNIFATSPRIHTITHFHGQNTLKQPRIHQNRCSCGQNPLKYTSRIILMELRRCWYHLRQRYPDFAQNCNTSGIFWAIRDGGVAFFAGFGRFWWFLPTTLAAFWAFDAGGVLIFSKLSEKQLKKRLENFQKNASQNLEFNTVVQFLIFYRQFSTFYAFAFCFRFAPLVLFCTIGFVSHYQFVQLKIFGVHQLQQEDFDCKS